MKSWQRFEYWPELMLVLIMLTVLLIDVALFDSLWPSGEGGDQLRIIKGK